MEYYIAKTIVQTDFSKAEELVTEKLKEQGFGIVTQIDMQATLKAKIDKEIWPYKILGACSPGFAFKVISAEAKIDVMLPCNVCLQQNDDNSIEVFAGNPLVAMESIHNNDVEAIAKEITAKLEAVLAAL